MKKTLLLVFLSFLALFFGATQAKADVEQDIDFVAMLEDMKAYTKEQWGEAPHPFTTHIAEKYIPLGMDQKALLEQCQENGWEVRELTPYVNKNRLKEYDAVYDCGIFFRLNWYDFWGRVNGLSLDFKDGKLKKRTSRVFYKHPLF